MIYCLDYLGGAKFPDVILKTHPANFGAGFFSNTFGDALPTVEKLLATGRCSLIRLHLLWKDDHHFTSADLPSIVKEAKRCAYLVKKFPKVKFYFSGACEHSLNFADALRLSELVTAASPGATYVNTPLPEGAVLPDGINESHGGGKPRSKKYAFSFDGTGAEDADVESVKKAFSGAEYFALWTCRFNGRWSTNDTTPRPNRNGWPDSNTIKAIAFLANPKGKTSLPPNWTLKPLAENKGNNDPRASKPVFIIPIKAGSIELKSHSGQLVQSLKYYGDYVDGRSRYYASDWGFHISEQAEHEQNGDPTVDVFVNGKRYGTVNSAFRDGSYR